jgi:hypothetical protein
MLRFGLVRLLAVLVFGVAIPWAIFRLSRAIGAPLTLVGAAALGLAYGAVKADHPWAGEGLSDNLRIMAVSAAVILGYAGVSLAVTRALVRFRRSRP